MHSFYSIGFFGIPNLGDELLAAMVVAGLRAEFPGCTLRLQTRDARLSRRYAGIEAEFVEGHAPWPEYLRHLPHHVRAVARSDLVVIGGGGLIGDRYGWTAIPRYAIDACWAVLLGKPYVFVGLGVPGIRRRWLRPLTRFLCRHAAAACCRDPASAARLKALGGRDDVAVAPDLGNLVRMRFSSLPEPRGYALMNFREKPPLNESRLAELCGELVERCGELVLLVAEASDVGYYERIVAGWPARWQAATRIVNPLSLDEAIRWICEARVVAAERLHVNLLAAHAGRPLLTLDYEEKVGKFVASLGGGSLVCMLDEMGADWARRLVATDAPAWSSRLDELAREAQAGLVGTVRKGLNGRPYRARTRALALVHLLGIMLVTVACSVVVIVKRLLFGRRSRPHPALGSGG